MKRIFAAVAFMISAFVHAASPYPEKSITIVNPFGAGTASDTVIRALGNRLGSALNVPVVVENRPGANGIVGTLRGVRAPNDGYTIFVTTGTTVSQNPWLFKDINYDPMTDFVGIAVLGGFPLSIVVPPQSPYRDFKELMQAIHTSTQGITYATAYGMQTVCGELLGKAAKGKVLGIPYKSTPPAVLDVTAGRVAFACGETATTLSALRPDTAGARGHQSCRIEIHTRRAVGPGEPPRFSDHAILDRSRSASRDRFEEGGTAVQGDIQDCVGSCVCRLPLGAGLRVDADGCGCHCPVHEERFFEMERPDQTCRNPASITIAWT